MREREDSGVVAGWVKLGVGEWVAGRVSELGGKGSRMGEWAALAGVVKYSKASGILANEEERISLNRSLAGFNLATGDVVLIKCTERKESGFRVYKVYDVSPDEIRGAVKKAGGDPDSALVREAARLWPVPGDTTEPEQTEALGEVDDELPF